MSSWQYLMTAAILGPGLWRKVRDVMRRWY